MKRILRIALRDFVAVVLTKGFIIACLSLPVILAIVYILIPRFFDDRRFQIEGEYAIVDPTGLVFREMNNALDSEGIAKRRLEAFRQLEPEMVRTVAETALEELLDEAFGPAPNVRLLALSAGTDIEAKKAWLNEEPKGLRHTALIIIHENAVEVSSAPKSKFGAYDLYVPPGLDDRDLNFIHNSVQEAIVNARISTQSLDRGRIEALIRVPRQESITVDRDGEQPAVDNFNFILPLAFMVLMLMGILNGGQTMLTSTIEEKSSRIVEVLLSAVSPMELMAGKLIAGVAVSLVTMGLYILGGLILLSSFSFSLFGLFDLWLIPYLLIFFLIGFFVIGALMLSVGAAVNEVSEAGTLITPLIMLVIMPPLVSWSALSRNPDSVLAIVLSYIPPINSFGMFIRMSSTQPPPWWEVWLSIGVGVGSVVGALWVAAKVFRIGVLMYGKPPNLKILIRWIRAV